MAILEQFLNNPEAKRQYLLKLKIISLIREFFSSRGLLEVEPPILNDSLIPESYLDIFSTEERRIGLEGKFKKKMYLATSPEAFQKKLLALGFGSNFALTRSFRNGEPISGKHLSEFSMLEWYEEGSNYENVMVTTEELILFIAEKLAADANFSAQNTLNSTTKNSSTEIFYKQGRVVLKKPWIRMSINELFKQYLSIDLEDSWDSTRCEFSVKLLNKIVAQKNLPLEVKNTTTWEQLYSQMFSIYIEPNLPVEAPVIVCDFPHEQSPLAKPRNGQKVSGNVWAERFEVMISGLEICDTYTENTDPKLQEQTFKNEISKISKKRKYKYDYEFIEALKLGLPACSGNAMGIDRLVMLFGNFSEILKI